MIQITGLNNTAYVYADVIDEGTKDQIRRICDHRVSAGSHIAVMPDTHVGKGSVIGWTQTVTDRICPNIVGVDIGCCITATNVGRLDHVNFDLLDYMIRTLVPAGHNVHVEGYDDEHGRDLVRSLKCYKHLKNEDYIVRSVGSLGGGNHFLELDRDRDTGEYWLVVHTGSRNLGKQVCEHYMSLDRDTQRDAIQMIRSSFIQTLKNQGRHREIQDQLEKLDERLKIEYGETVENDPLHYLTGDNCENYLHDVDITTAFALHNNRRIGETIIHAMNWGVHDYIISTHNYVDVLNRIIRKGAVAAYEHQRLIVPINMAFGTCLCTGLGNNEMNYSAPHGAGRLLSRRAAHDAITLEQFEKSMDGIYSTCVTNSTIDESPFVYKHYEDIERNLKLTATVDKIIKPVYNFKAGGE